MSGYKKKNYKTKCSSHQQLRKRLYISTVNGQSCLCIRDKVNATYSCSSRSVAYCFSWSRLSHNQKCVSVHVCLQYLPSSIGGMFQDPQGMSETVDSTEHYLYYFSDAYIPMIMFNL